MLNKYDRAENFGDVKGTKVNPEMWTQLIPRKPKIDLQLSNMQQVVRKVAFATLQTTNFWLQNGSGSTNAILITQSVGVIALLGYVNNHAIGSIPERTDQAFFKEGILNHLQC